MNARLVTAGTTIAVSLLVPFVEVQAQYKNKSPAEILREAQEQQRAIDQAGRDLQRNLSKILEEQQAQQARERQLQQEEQQARKQEEQARRERQEEARLQREAEAERQRQARAQQQLQENARQFQANQPSPTQPRIQTFPTPNTGSMAAEAAAPGPLAGSPNDQGARPEGWSAWKLVSNNIWISFCNVNRNSPQSKPVWTWSLKNWNSRATKTIWIEYNENGKWSKDLNPVSLQPGGAYGGWGTFTAEGPQPPAVRVTSVDYK